MQASACRHGLLCGRLTNDCVDLSLLFLEHIAVFQPGSVDLHAILPTTVVLEQIGSCLEGCKDAIAFGVVVVFGCAGGHLQHSTWRSGS